jgi:hypothetical protein
MVTLLLSFPKEMLGELYSWLDFVSHIRFSGTCKKLRCIGKIILPRNEAFIKKKMEFVFARLMNPKIWEGGGWVNVLRIGELYDILYYPFKRTDMNLRNFLQRYKKTFVLSHGCVWNVDLFGPPTDKYSF